MKQIPKYCREEKEFCDEYKCNIHNLSFEYPIGWLELNFPPPKCPLCSMQEIYHIEQKLSQIIKKYDILLEAIDIKLCSIREKN